MHLLKDQALSRLVSSGSILVALAAVFAAGLAAWIARKNHAEQLAHDRAIRDLGHARQSLSAAVETVADAVDSVTNCLVPYRRQTPVVRMRTKSKPLMTNCWRPLSGMGDLLVDTRIDHQLEGESVPLLGMEQAAVQEEKEAVSAETEAIEKTTRLGTPMPH